MNLKEIPSRLRRAWGAFMADSKPRKNPSEPTSSASSWTTYGTSTPDRSGAAVGLTADSIRDHIPPYLTKDEKDGLLRELAAWPRPIKYYTPGSDAEILQGDTWTKIPIRNSETGELAQVNGLVLSNSCAIDPENTRSIPPKVVVAPLVDLERYGQLLAGAGFTKEQVVDRMSAIREQRVHNIFFLPAGAKLAREHIVLLDDLHSFPAAKLTDSLSTREKLATLATTGFYLFLFKLSVHFCRFSENVPRGPQADPV